MNTVVSWDTFRGSDKCSVYCLIVRGFCFFLLLQMNIDCGGAVCELGSVVSGAFLVTHIFSARFVPRKSLDSAALTE